MRENLRLGLVAILILFVSWLASPLRADTFTRNVNLQTDADQIVVGGFGSGVFWRPSFEIEPIAISVGDTIEVDVHFDQPVTVVAGGDELESAGSFLSAPGLSLSSTQFVTWELLGVRGALVVPSFSTSTAGSGSGIGAHTAGISGFDLTDSAFSFQRMRFSITLNSGSGFPAVFTEGAIAIQTQGTIRFGNVPEPSALLMAVACLGNVIIFRRQVRANSCTPPGANR
jgi:hypothetical protein